MVYLVSNYLWPALFLPTFSLCCAWGTIVYTTFYSYLWSSLSSLLSASFLLYLLSALFLFTSFARTTGLHFPRVIPRRSSSRTHHHTWWGCCVFDISQPSLPTPFSVVLVSVSVFMTLSTVFHSINSPDNSPLFLSVLPVFVLPYWSFELYIIFWRSPSALI